MTTLHFIGGGAFRPDLPSRDIDAAELAWMAKSRKVDAAEIVATAVGSGLFVADGAAAEVVAQAAAAVPDKPLDEMSRDELRAGCADLGLGQAGSKADLLERIRARLAETPEVPERIRARLAETPEVPES